MSTKWDTLFHNQPKREGSSSYCSNFEVSTYLAGTPDDDGVLGGLPILVCSVGWRIHRIAMVGNFHLNGFIGPLSFRKIGSK